MVDVFAAIGGVKNRLREGDYVLEISLWEFPPLTPPLAHLWVWEKKGTSLEKKRFFPVFHIQEKAVAPFMFACGLNYGTQETDN